MEHEDPLINNILVAADRWSREVLRSADYIGVAEGELLEAVMAWKNSKKVAEIAKFPPPPYIPKDIMEQIPGIKLECDKNTDRYSAYTTKPSPPFGTPINGNKIKS
jgi:hypothetical protein